MIGGLFLSWVLSLFGFVQVAQTDILELFGISISVGTYYFIFAVLGAVTKPIRIKLNNNNNYRRD